MMSLKMKENRRQFRISGAKIEESLLLAKFFLTLPAKFDALVTSLQTSSRGIEAEGQA